MLRAALACLASFAVTSRARAECPFFVVPPATEAADTAREIIVGTVVENVDAQLYDFRLRIDHVVRGAAEVGDLRRFEFLYPGWPLSGPEGGPQSGPCSAIPGWEGNVIALSLDALAPDGRTRYNAASWILGTPLHRDDVPRTTLLELEALARMPATDTQPAADASASDADQPPPIVALFGLLAVILGIRRATAR